MNIVFYCLDLETNGLNNLYHEICELSIVRATDKMQLTRQVRVDKVENSSLDALRIIKKSMNDLKSGISKHQLISDFEKFVNEDSLTPEHRCIIGHNIINFDKKFLWRLWELHNKQFPFTLYLDTMHLIRAFCKKNGILKPKTNLQSACDIVGVKKVAGEHNASSDTQNCYLLWKKLMETVDFLEHIKRIPHSNREIEY
jgi:DNA polymerase III epsilon subunit-like protein